MALSGVAFYSEGSASGPVKSPTSLFALLQCFDILWVENRSKFALKPANNGNLSVVKTQQGIGAQDSCPEVISGAIQRGLGFLQNREHRLERHTLP